MNLLRDGAHIFVNSLVFNAPKAPKYSFESDAQRHGIVYVPITGLASSLPSATAAFDPSTAATTYYVPCSYTRDEHPCTLMMVHFHGTSGDIVKSGLYRDLHNSRGSLPPGVHSLNVEFPSYGTASPVVEYVDVRVATGGATIKVPFHICASRETLLKIAECIIEFITTKLAPGAAICLSGRSKGTGIALETAIKMRQTQQQSPLCGVILISPYASIVDVACGLVGRSVGGFVGRCMHDAAHALLMRLLRFGRATLSEPAVELQRLGAAAHHASSPVRVLICHGAKDTLIPIDHAHTLRPLIAQAFGAPVVQLHVDQDGGHSDLKYKQQLIDFVRSLHAGVLEQKRTSVRESADAPFAPPEVVAVLQTKFPSDCALANSYRATATRALAVTTLVAVVACAAAGYLLTSFAWTQLKTYTAALPN